MSIGFTKKTMERGIAMRKKTSQKMFVYVLSLAVLFTLGLQFKTVTDKDVKDNLVPGSKWTESLQISAPKELPFVQTIAPMPITETALPQTLEIKTEPVLEPAPVPVTETKADIIAAEPPLDTYEVTAYYLNIREGSNAKSKILKTIKQGDQIEILTITENGWLQLKDGGYIHGGYAKLVDHKAVKSRVTIQSFSESKKKVNEIHNVIPKQMNTKIMEVQKINDPETNDHEEESVPSQPTSVVASDSGLTVEHIAQIFEGTALADYDLEEAILEIEEEYGINAYFTIAVMKLESGNGKSKLAKNKNNLFGLNAIDGDEHNRAFSFKTKSDSVLKFGQLLSKSYVGKGLKTIDKVAKKYCPSNNKWAGLVKKIMKSDYKKL